MSNLKNGSVAVKGEEHAKGSDRSCPCGWGRHCLCVYDWHFDNELESAVRLLLSSGGDLAKRRRAHERMRDTIDLIDQRARDKKALTKLFDTLPRRKDIDLVRRILNDDARSRVWSDEEISNWMSTPIEHVRDLRARVAAVFDGNPLPVPRVWREMAKERRTREQERWAARKAARRARRAA